MYTPYEAALRMVSMRLV